MSGTGRAGDGHGRLGSMLSGLVVAVGLVLFLGGFAWGALVLDAIAWPMDGKVERPQVFAALPGGVSAPGLLKLQLGAVVAGVVLIFGGSVYGPIAARSARRRIGQDRRVPAGAH